MPSSSIRRKHGLLQTNHFHASAVPKTRKRCDRRCGFDVVGLNSHREWEISPRTARLTACRTNAIFVVGKKRRLIFLFSSLLYIDSKGTPTMKSIRSGAAVFGMLLAQLVFAQAYPTAKSISLVVAFPVGGGTDIVARMVADKMREALKASVVVDNKPGGEVLVRWSALEHRAV